MIFAPRATGVSVFPQIVDDLGLPVTGLAAADWPDTFWMITGQSLPSAIGLSDLAAQNSAWSSGGVKEMSGGVYRLDVPNAAFAFEGQGRIIAEETDKRLILPAYQISARLARKQAEVRVCSKTTAGTTLQFDCWLREGAAPINLDDVDSSATCELTVWMFDSDVPQFTVATGDFGAPDEELGRFRAEYEDPNLTADRIHLIDVTITSQGIAYRTRKSFTPLP